MQVTGSSAPSNFTCQRNSAQIGSCSQGMIAERHHGACKCESKLQYDAHRIREVATQTRYRRLLAIRISHLNLRTGPTVLNTITVCRRRRNGRGMSQLLITMATVLVGPSHSRIFCSLHAGTKEASKDAYRWGICDWLRHAMMFTLQVRNAGCSCEHLFYGFG